VRPRDQGRRVADVEELTRGLANAGLALQEIVGRAGRGRHVLGERLADRGHLRRGLVVADARGVGPQAGHVLERAEEHAQIDDELAHDAPGVERKQPAHGGLGLAAVLHLDAAAAVGLQHPAAIHEIERVRAVVAKL
jgi:hypothetical protein